MHARRMSVNNKIIEETQNDHVTLIGKYNRSQSELRRLKRENQDLQRAEESRKGHTTSIEPNDDDEDQEFYREDKNTPTHLFLLPYSERKDYEELRSKARLTILKTKRLKALFKTQEEIKAMSDDSIVTAIKDHREGGEAKLMDLEECKEAMLFLMNLTGKNISPRQRKTCMNILLKAKSAEEAALQFMA